VQEHARSREANPGKNRRKFPEKQKGKRVRKNDKKIATESPSLEKKDEKCLHKKNAEKVKWRSARERRLPFCKTKKKKGPTKSQQDLTKKNSQRENTDSEGGEALQSQSFGGPRPKNLSVYKSG